MIRKLYKKLRIHIICWKYKIKYFTINKDFTIDVNGNVNIAGERLRELPLKFNIVTGDFNCAVNELVSLDVCPKKIGGFFDCSYNKLKTLIGGPSSVGGNYDCFRNFIVSLDGLPKEIDFRFLCILHNPVIEILSLFDNDINKYTLGLDYFYLQADGKIDKKKLADALEEINKSCPDKMINYSFL